jgi:ATP-binding cassette subfamily B protein
MNEEYDVIDNQEKQDIMDDGMSAERAQNAKGTLKRFFKDLMKQKWGIFAVLVCIAAASVFTVLTPTLIGEAINRI